MIVEEIISITDFVPSNASLPQGPILPITAQSGNVFYDTTHGQLMIYNGSTWIQYSYTPIIRSSK